MMLEMIYVDMMYFFAGICSVFEHSIVILADPQDVVYIDMLYIISFIQRTSIHYSA